MILRFKLCLLLSLSNVLAQNETLAKLHQNSPTNSTTLLTIANSTKIISEGGPILFKDPTLDLSKENPLSPPKSEKVKKTSSVVRKNGVKFTSEELASLNSTTETQMQIKSHPRTNQSMGETPEKHLEKSKQMDTFTTKISTQGTTVKPKVHKPLVLSYEALAKMDHSQKLSSLPIVKSSSKSMADQLPASDDDSSFGSKIYSLNTGKHPGMIMPIVITILVVPMFAVLAYMAVKRGQEAWKNRHYKRMDFLLDGMYND